MSRKDERGLWYRRDRRDKRDRVPYYKYAFSNVYNYTAMLGIGAAALLTQNWWLGVVGAGCEALWMVFAPDSRLLRRLWFDKVHSENQKLLESGERARVLGSVAPGERRRYEELERERQKILRLAGENPSFTIELLRDELAKLEQLSASFLDLLVSCSRYESYLSTIDVKTLEADIRRYTRLVEDAKDDEAARLASKNLAILTQRRERIAEIRRFVAQAYGQMDLIENTFRLLADQIVTMHSPGELGGQLDELIGGVEAVRSSAREAEALLQE